MDDCGSRIKQLEQLLSEYQDRLQLDKDSDFAEGIFIMTLISNPQRCVM